MAWLRIDDRVRTHPKIALAGPAAAWLWFCSICYCREHLTDGFIPHAAVASLAINLPTPKKHAAKLVEVRLWESAKGGFHVHDFLEWNPTRAEVMSLRDKEREKKRTQRGHHEGHGAGQVGDPPRDRAGDAGLGSDLGFRSGSSSSEESSRETTLTRRGPGLISSPLEWHHKHGAIHVSEFCDFVCFPNDLAANFARKVTGVTPEQARAQVLEWAREIRRRWQGRTVPDGSDYDFWRHRWTETHGGSKPTTSGAAPDPLAGLRKAK